VKVLYDTSVLVASLLSQHPDHAIALPYLENARNRLVQGYISTHSLAEIYAVTTRLPRLKITPDEAKLAIDDLLQYMRAVPLVANDYQAAMAQMTALQLPGGGIYDALIARAALAAKVDQLVTLNPKDFIRLSSEIAALVEVPQ
jgi:predicted nucleic acid-binding protein